MGDKEYLKKCIELSEKSLIEGDMPIGSLVVLGDRILSMSCNKAHTCGDKTLHAEIIVLREAQNKLNRADLSDCVLYSNLEPCPMCSFMIRELRVKKVVFSLKSEHMGGYSKYHILCDTSLNSTFPHHFGPPPELVMGLLKEEADKVWDKRRESLCR